MESSTTTSLRIGDWCVDAKSGEISRNGESARLDTRTMRLLFCLAGRMGEVVSIQELLEQVWPDVFVAPDSVYQAVTTLRRQLGDDPKRPTYIETVPRLGYRMVAAVEPWAEHSAKAEAAAQDSNGGDRRAETPAKTVQKSKGLMARPYAAWMLAAVVLLAFAGALLVRARMTSKTLSASTASVAPLPERSIAVLPFLDLTEGMKEEEFADGITEELIDKLSKIPGLRVPPPTSSFYFKNKHVPVAEIAKSLGVVYVLDGSTRKSGNRLRVAARLVRADSAYVLWSETYDRPWEDSLKIQDEIAGEVAKALKASIAGSPGEEN